MSCPAHPIEAPGPSEARGLARLPRAEAGAGPARAALRRWATTESGRSLSSVVDSASEDDEDTSSQPRKKSESESESDWLRLEEPEETSAMVPRERANRRRANEESKRGERTRRADEESGRRERTKRAGELTTRAGRTSRSDGESSAICAIPRRHPFYYQKTLGQFHCFNSWLYNRVQK